MFEKKKATKKKATTRYKKWMEEHRKIKGVLNPPYSLMIQLEKLHISRVGEEVNGYQRGEKTRLEKAVAKYGWSDALCTALIVVKRPDGTFWVVDGQQRLKMLREMGRETALCIVIDTGGDAKTEAALFVLYNGTSPESGVLPVTPFEIYESDLVFEEPDALLVQEVTEQINYRIAQKGQTTGRIISCIQKMREWARRDSSIFEKGMKLCAHLADGDRIDNRLLNGLCHLESHLKRLGLKESVFDRKNVTRIEGHSLRKLYVKMDDIGATDGKSGNNVPRAQANAILRILNKKRRTNRIPML